MIALGIVKGKSDPYELVNDAMEYLISNKDKYMDHPNIKAIAVLKMKGLFIDTAIAFPKLSPTDKQTIKPGPAVEATASISLIFFPLFCMSRI